MNNIRVQQDKSETVGARRGRKRETTQTTHAMKEIELVYDGMNARHGMNARRIERSSYPLQEE